MIVQGLWDQQAEAIIDVKLGYADADYYKYEPMEPLLTCWETIKKDKYRNHYNYQWKRFLPFVLPFDGMLWR